MMEYKYSHKYGKSKFAKAVTKKDELNEHSVVTHLDLPTMDPMYTKDAEFTGVGPQNGPGFNPPKHNAGKNAKGGFHGKSTGHA